MVRFQPNEGINERKFGDIAKMGVYANSSSDMNELGEIVSKVKHNMR